MEKTTVPFVDITKIIEQLQVPGIDVATIVDARRRDTTFDVSKRVQQNIQESGIVSP